MSQRVTIAIPVFNGMPHIKTAIESVLEQTHPDLDVVVIDNCSTDGTLEYVESIEDPRVRLIKNETNVGLEGNWNKALEQSSESLYFKLVCADDRLYANAIATEVAALEAHPQASMTASKRVIIDDNEKVIIKERGLPGMSGLIDGPTAIRRSLRWGTNVIGEPTSSLIRSSALKDIGPFDGTFQYLIDFDMWARVLQRGDLYCIATPLAAFRVGVLSNSGAIAKKQLQHHIGEFRKLAAEPNLGISAPRLKAAEAAAVAVCTARRGLYRALDLRKRISGGYK